MFIRKDVMGKCMQGNRQRQVKPKQITKQDHVSSDSNNGNKLMSTLSIMDLMYRVEDALRWDKYSTQTKHLVEKFREELNHNYTERDEAGGGEGKRRRGTVRKRETGGSGREGFREDWVQEMEQVLAMHFASGQPQFPGEEHWEAPRGESVLDLPIVQHILSSKSKKKKLLMKGSRKRLGHHGHRRDYCPRYYSRRGGMFEPVPIFGPEQSLSSIHFEKEPETYINLTEAGGEPELGMREEKLTKLVVEINKATQIFGPSRETSQRQLPEDSTLGINVDVSEIKYVMNIFNPKTESNNVNLTITAEDVSGIENNSVKVSDAEIAAESKIEHIQKNGENSTPLQNKLYEKKIDYTVNYEKHNVNFNENQEDKNSEISKKNNTELVKVEEPFVEVRETTGNVIKMTQTRNKILNYLRNNKDHQNFSFTLTLLSYPWDKRVFVSPQSGKLIGYTRRECICLKVPKVYLETTAVWQITREYQTSIIQISSNTTNNFQIAPGKEPNQYFKTLNFLRINTEFHSQKTAESQSLEGVTSEISSVGDICKLLKNSLKMYLSPKKVINS